MTETAERLKQELSQLDEHDRAELAEYLIYSLGESGDEEADGAWEIELSRRLGEIESGQAIGTPADLVFAQLREKHS